MRLPWKCPTAIDAPCPQRLIEQVGWVKVRYIDFSDSAPPQWEPLGRCRRCGREHTRFFRWSPTDSMITPPPDAAKRYTVSRGDELSALRLENQRLRDRLATKVSPLGE